MAKGDIDKAASDYSRAIATDACDAWSYYNRGNLWMQKGDYDKALADYNNAVGISPKLALAYFGRAAMWVKKQEYDKAITDYTAALAIDPLYFAAYMGRAEAQFAKKDYDKTILDFSWAIKADGRSTMAYGSRGTVYSLKGDFDSAIADYTMVLQLDPNLLQAYYLRGASWFGKGETDNAIADFAEAQRRAPAEPSFPEALGKCYEKKGDQARAADSYMRAGEIRIFQKDWNNSILDWNAAIKADSKRAEAFQQRAESYAKLGQYDLSITDYAQALALSPGQTEWAQRLKELKTTPHPPAPKQTADAPAPPPPASAPRTASASPAATSKQKWIIQGTLLHYPDRAPLPGKQIIFGIYRDNGGGFEPNGAPIATTDSQGLFRMGFNDDVRQRLAPSDKMFSLLVYKEGDSVVDGTPIGAVAQIATPHAGMTTKWELPGEPGILDLDKGGALYLNDK